MESCPQCCDTININSSLFVRIKCGHKKCRKCIIEEDIGCNLCNSDHQQSGNQSQTSSAAQLLDSYCENYDSTVVQKNRNDYGSGSLHALPISEGASLVDSQEKCYREDNLMNEFCTESSPFNDNGIPDFNKVSSNNENERCSSNIKKSKSIGIHDTESDKSDIDNDLVEVNDQPKGSTPSSKIDNSTVKKKNKRFVIKSHIKVIKGSPNKYHCTACSKVFEKQTNVYYHNYCGTDNKPLKCNICGKGFVIKSHFLYHQKIHTGERPFTCNICQASFRQRDKLVRHMTCHSNEKPHICKTCGKSFKNLDNLRTHELVHANVKPFTCNICNKKFNHRTNYRKHYWMHSGEKPYICEVCGRRYVSKSSLDSHLKSHLQVREHVCNLCQKAFFNIKYLKRHYLVHANGNEFQCTYCNMSFKRKDILSRHVKNTHLENGLSIPLGESTTKKAGTKVITSQSEELPSQQSEGSPNQKVEGRKGLLCYRRIVLPKDGTVPLSEKSSHGEVNAPETKKSKKRKPSPKKTLASDDIRNSGYIQVPQYEIPAIKKSITLQEPKTQFTVLQYPHQIKANESTHNNCVPTTKSNLSTNTLSSVSVINGSLVEPMHRSSIESLQNKSKEYNIYAGSDNYLSENLRVEKHLAKEISRPFTKLNILPSTLIKKKVYNENSSVNDDTEPGYFGSFKQISAVSEENNKSYIINKDYEENLSYDKRLDNYTLRSDVGKEQKACECFISSPPENRSNVILGHPLTKQISTYENIRGGKIIKSTDNSHPMLSALLDMPCSDNVLNLTNKKTTIDENDFGSVDNSKYFASKYLLCSNSSIGYTYENLEQQYQIPTQNLSSNNVIVKNSTPGKVMLINAEEIENSSHYKSCTKSCTQEISNEEGTTCIKKSQEIGL